MKTLTIVLRDHIYDLIDDAATLRGKSVYNVLDDLLSEYFTFCNKKPVDNIKPAYDFSNEIWKDIPGYEGQYQASSMGRIASIRNGFKIRSCVRNPTGYLQISFTVNKKIKTYLVHVVIAKTFLEQDSVKNQVDHINNIKTDNRVVNLKWATRSENMKNNYLRGVTDLEKLGARGRKVELFDINNKSLGIFNKVADAAKFLNTSSGNVSSLCDPNNIRVKSLTKNKITGKFL
jgi:hypothetical protein